MKYFLIVFLLLSGCASVSKVDPQSVAVGTEEKVFLENNGNRGQKIYLSNTDGSNFLWLLDLGNERVWLTGNAAFGGIATQRHHTMVVEFHDGKVSNVLNSNMDGINKNRMPAEVYKSYYWLMESLVACKSGLSISQRARYESVVGQALNSWIYAPEVFDRISQYNGGFRSYWSQNQCADAFVVIERIGADIDRGTANLGG